MAFSQQRRNRSGNQQQQQQWRILCDVNREDDGGQHLLRQRAHHLDHGDPVRRLRFGPLQPVVVIGILKRRNVELGSMLDDANADVLHVQDRPAGCRKIQSRGSEWRPGMPARTPARRSTRNGEAALYGRRRLITISLISQRETARIATGNSASAMRRTIDHTTVFGPHSHTIFMTGGMLRIAAIRVRHVSPYDLGMLDSVTAGRDRI